MSHTALTHFIDVPLDKNSPGYTPTFLSVNVKPARRVVDTKLHSAPILSRLRPTNHMLEKSQGSIEHTMEVDGVANVCIRAAAASSTKPMRFGIRVVKTDTDPIVAQKGKTELDTHLSHMEVEMKRLTMGMSTILKEADFAKERDSVFHQQTVSMHAATTFWPMVQVSVLLLTGFTQASHIVRFFQSRRII